MKKTLVILFMFPLAAFAAAPSVVIDDSFNAIVDGKNWGAFGDVVVNNKTNAELIVAVNIAVMAKAIAMKTETNAAVVAKLSAEARIDSIVTALKAVDPKALPAAVLTVLRTRSEAEKAAILAKKAELDAALAKLP